MRSSLIFDLTHHCLMFDCHDLIELPLGNSIAEIKNFIREIAIFLFEHLQVMSNNVSKIADDFNFWPLKTPAHIVAKRVRIMRRRNTNHTAIEKYM